MNLSGNHYRLCIPLLAAAAGLMPCGAGAAIVSFTQASSPPGILSSSANVETGTVVATQAAPLVSSTNTFTHWTLNGVRRSDASGRSLNPASFTIFEPMAAVANYLPTTQDSDADGLPDFYEIEFFGSLIRIPASDNDGDGISVADERSRNFSPAVANSLFEGGISRRRGGKVLMVAPSQFTLTETSNPSGIINRTSSVFQGTSLNLSIAPDPSEAFRFTGWYSGSVRVDSPLALQPASFIVNANTTLVARYIDQALDSDTDGIPDWYEQFNFGNLTNNGAQDADNDGFSLSQELIRGQSPQVLNQILEGGISRRRGVSVTISPLSFVTCTLTSIPSGLVNQTINTVAGAEVVSQNLWGTDISGLRFIGWEMGGNRLLDPSGAAAGIARFIATQGAVATARFVSPTEDVDSDGVADWYEWVYLGNLGATAASDTDGDGISLVREFSGGLSPLTPSLVAEGGISRRRSAGKTGVNLQHYERLDQMLVAGVLAPWFSSDPAVSPPQAQDFGSNSSPVFCDWDGDGDLDLFIASSGAIAVYENIGSRFRMDLADRSANFGGLATLCAGMTAPHLASGDWNLDGRQDLALTDGLGSLRLIPSSQNFSGTGNGGGSSTFSPTTTGVFPAMGDLNGDGNVDLLLAAADGTISCYLHTGNPAIPYDSSSNTGLAGQVVEQISSLTIGDVTLDGRNDVLAADRQGRIWEFHNQIDGSFLLKSKVWGGSGVGFAPSPSITAGDLEGDGDIDLIGACPDGGIFALRDPKVGRPTGLTATPGADTVLLEWNPDWQSRIKGYHVYRANDAISPKSRINPDGVEMPRHVDENLQLTANHFYQVTALTQAIYAGNSVPTIVESPPSATVSAPVRRVTLDLQDTSGFPGSTVGVFLSIGNSIGLSGQVMELRIQYPLGLTPVSQVSPGELTVEASGLGTDLVFTSNEATANGELIIQGSSGLLESGQGKLFTLNFRIAPGTVVGTTLQIGFASAAVRDALGNSVPVTLAGATVQVSAGGTAPPPGGGIEVGPFGKGDISGDGWVNETDNELLKTFLPSSGPEPSPAQLSAGDTNGDGEINHRDLIGIRRIRNGLKP